MSRDRHVVVPPPPDRRLSPRPLCGGCGARLTPLGGWRYACHACAWGRAQAAAEAAGALARADAADRRGRLLIVAMVAFAAGVWLAALAGRLL